jgi:hypothetical protein
MAARCYGCTLLVIGCSLLSAASSMCMLLLPKLLVVAISNDLDLTCCKTKYQPLGKVDTPTGLLWSLMDCLVSEMGCIVEENGVVCLGSGGWEER